jgi:peptide/nickel transport system substrate-binding protein
MHNSMPTKGFTYVRIPAAVILILSEITIAGWFTSGWASQDPANLAAQQGQTEPGKSKQTGRKPKEEEEETTKPPRKVPLRVGDEDLDANQPPSARPGGVPPADLEREAKRARHPVVQELFSRLARPHDVVTMPSSRVWNVEPIPEYMSPKPKLTRSLSVQSLDANWKRGPSFSVSSNEILGVEPYEQLALNRVDEFLKSGLDRDPESKQYLPRSEMLQEAEKVLGTVLLFHDSAKERGLRKGDAWNELRERLLARLQKVQLDQLQALTDLKNWEAALELGIRLGEAYPTQKDVQSKIVGLLARSAREPFKDKNYGLAQQRLFVLESQFPHSPVLEPIRADLQKIAKEFLKEADKLEKQKQTAAAMESLNMAKQIYPQLPGLHDFDLRLNKQNPILHVGVRDLPKYLSPATATLDSEKQAVELAFESLLKLTTSSKMGQRYQPILASDLPKKIPLGRQFTLARGAYWSDGHPVTATDVRRTVDLLSDPKWPGYIPEWADLFKDGTRIEGDSFHISLTLHRGYVDPLSLMNFKVLPESADDPQFATTPIGSGPYQLQKRAPDSVVLVANPYYELRPGKRGLPRIREIHFVRSENPANDFLDGQQLQLLLDLPTSSYKALNSAGLGQQVTFKTLPNRRIYFLAVNHGRPPLDKLELRRAIAHAIPREDILNKCFREGLMPPPHRPLNGPYPPRSWAYNPNLKLSDPYNLDLAKAQAALAKDSRAVPCKLTLKYPKGDPAVAEACNQIKESVQKVTADIDLELKPLEARDLRRDVEERRDYDLAYYSWDYPDETYWLWPLFDPSATKLGGRNFLNYQNDADLQSYFRKAMSHRDPAEIKSLTHEIHNIFYAKMPFIPLWQLDTHLAIHQSLSIVDAQGRPLDPDPLLIFSGVETWNLDKR